MSDLVVEPVEGAEPVEPAEETWAPSREDFDTLVAQTNWLAEQYQQSQQQQQGGATIDPLADDFQAQLDRYIDQRMAPYQTWQQQQIGREGEQQALDVLADLQASKGEFLLKDTAERAVGLARELYPDYAARYGNNDRAGEAALEAAYEKAREYEAAIGKAYLEREQNQLATLAGAPRSPARPGNPAIQQLATVEGGTLQDVYRKYFPDGQ